MGHSRRPEMRPPPRRASVGVDRQRTERECSPSTERTLRRRGEGFVRSREGGSLPCADRHEGLPAVRERERGRERLIDARVRQRSAINHGISGRYILCHPFPHTLDVRASSFAGAPFAGSRNRMNMMSSINYVRAYLLHKLY